MFALLYDNKFLHCDNRFLHCDIRILHDDNRVFQFLYIINSFIDPAFY